MLQRIPIPTVHDRRGNLSFIEGGESVPFEIRRVYYLHDVPFRAERGGHAHRILQQAVIALAGRFVLRTTDGSEWVETAVDNPAEAVLVPQMVWRELVEFASGTVCLVLASEHYDPHDYIRDFATFAAEVHR